MRTTFLCLGYKATPQLLSKAEAGEEGKPPRAPLQGVHPDLISDWGSRRAGHRLYRGCTTARTELRSHGVEVCLFPYSCHPVTSSSPPRRLAALARSPPLPHRTQRQPPSYRRDQRAGWEVGGGKSTSGRSIEQLTGAAVRRGSFGPVYQREAPLSGQSGLPPRRPRVPRAGAGAKDGSCA